MVAEFLALFHRYSYILKPLQGSNWFSANENWALSDTEILKAIAGAHQKYLIGTRAGRASRYAVLDIDAGSKYHNKQSVDRIREILRDAGITETTVYRSSESGGWHLYIFFEELISSKDLRNQLTELLRLKGFGLAKGTLEVFPHPGEGSSGQGVRLPLQPGFAWLDQNTLEVEHERCEMSATRALTYFLDALESACNTRHDFHQLKRYVERLNESRQAAVALVKGKQPAMATVVPIRRNIAAAPDTDATAEVISAFRTLPPGIMPDIWSKGRQFAATGLTGPSQRAEAIFCLNHYLFYGDPEEGKPALGYGYQEERAWAVEEIISSRHNGQSKDIARGRPDALTQVKRAADWVPPHKRGQELKPYESKVPTAWKRHNAKLAMDARQRIQKALDEFTQERQAFSIRDLKAASGCCEKTLYRHQDLWRPVQENLRTNCLANVGDEYNAGEGAGSQETCPPAQPVQRSAPPGLLAARRIIHEISMRAAREERQKEKNRRSLLDLGVSRWRQQIITWLPPDLGSCDTKQLKAVLVVYKDLIVQSPDEEHQIWLMGIVNDLRCELERRNGHLGLVQNSS